MSTILLHLLQKKHITNHTTAKKQTSCVILTPLNSRSYQRMLAWNTHLLILIASMLILEWTDLVIQKEELFNWQPVDGDIFGTVRYEQKSECRRSGKISDWPVVCVYVCVHAYGWMCVCVLCSLGAVTNCCVLSGELISFATTLGPAGLANPSRLQTHRKGNATLVTHSSLQPWSGMDRSVTQIHCTVQRAISVSAAPRLQKD